MLLGILMGLLFFSGVLFGKEVLLIISGLPLIGNIAIWYMHFAEPLKEGVMTNMMYATIAVQIITLPIAVLIYSPSVIRKALRELNIRDKV